MNIGFTGTRTGINNNQVRALLELVTNKLYTINEFHHGDCTGADEQAHQLIDNKICTSNLDLIKEFVIHPPIYKDARAFCHKWSVTPCRVLKPKGYLTRNHNIADACDILIGCPRGKEIMRSGTWATIRYAKNKGKRIFIIYPKAVELIEERK